MEFWEAESRRVWTEERELQREVKVVICRWEPRMSVRRTAELVVGDIGYWRLLSVEGGACAWW